MTLKALDFFEEGTFGNKYLIFVIFSKLHGDIKSEIIHNVGSNYPSLGQIFASYSDIIQTLVITKPSVPSSPKPVKSKKVNHFKGGTSRRFNSGKFPS